MNRPLPHALNWKLFLVLFLLAAAVRFCSAEDLYLRDGRIVRNVKILEKKQLDNGDIMLVLKYGNTTSNVWLKDVANISYVPYSESLPSHIETAIASTPANASDSLRMYLENNMRSQQYVVQKQYPNLPWLAVAAVGFGLSWDYFSRAGDVQDVIDFNNRLAGALNVDVDNSRLESTKSRYSFLGVVFLGVGIVTTIHGLQTVELTTDGKSLSLTYNF